MKNITYVLCCFMLLSCTSNTIYKKPDNLIPKDTMILLLKDMYLASSAKNVKNKYKQRGIDYMAFIYEKYKIDSTRFKQSNVYYTSKIDDYKDLIATVKKDFKEKEKAFKEEIDILDSIKRQKNKKTRTIDTTATTAKMKKIDSSLLKTRLKKLSKENDTTIIKESIRKEYENKE